MTYTNPTADNCPHCPDGHASPWTRPWAVYVSTQLDGDKQPISLTVGRTNCSHVAESDAEWLRQVIRDAQAAHHATITDARRAAPAGQGEGK